MAEEKPGGYAIRTTSVGGERYISLPDLICYLLAMADTAPSSASVLRELAATLSTALD